MFFHRATRKDYRLRLFETCGEIVHGNFFENHTFSLLLTIYHCRLRDKNTKTISTE